MGRNTSTRLASAAVLAALVTAVLGPSAGASSFTIVPGGPAVTVNITTAGTTATATFSGTAGQRVSLNISSSTIASSKVSLLKPNGSALFAVSVATTAKFVDVTTLPVSGSYKLVVDPNSTYTGKMTLRLYNVPPDASGPLATDGATTTTLTTTTPGQNAAATFTGVAGHRIALRLTGVTVSAGSLSVFNPDSTKLYGRAFGRADTFVDPLPLGQSGTYTVTLDPKGLATGSVTLTAYDVPADTTATVAADGTPATATTTVPGQRAAFTFSGTAGQRVSLHVSSSDYVGSVSLLRSDASVVASLGVGLAGGFLEPTVLPATDTYTVLVDPSGAATGALTYSLYTVPADTTAAITAGGSPVTVTNTVPGQNNYLTFTGTANQRISVLVSNVSDDPGKLKVLKPDGTPLLASPVTVTSAGAYVETKTLPVSGAYKIFLDPQREATGSADVTLFTVPADLSGTIVLGTPLTVTTTAPGQNAKYGFTGTAGQRLSVNLTAVTMASVKVSILRPDGSTLTTKTVGTGGGFVEPVTLLVSGAYKVLVDPQTTSYGSVTVGLYAVPANSTGTVSAGVGAVVTTVVPGRNATRTFAVSGTVPQRLSFNFTSVTMPSVRVTVQTPTGGIVFSDTFSTDGDFVEPKTVTATGTYTVTIDPQGASTGSMTFTYYVVPADATGSSAVIMSTPGQNGKITFSVTGAAADRTFTVSTNVPPGAGQSTSVELKVFFGTTQIGGSEFAGPSGWTFTRNLAAGTYTIVVDPFGAAVGTVTVTVS